MYIPLLAAVIVAVPAGVAAQVSRLPAPAKPGPTVELSLPSAPAPGPYSNLFPGTLKAEPGKGQWTIIPGPNGEQREVQKPRTKVVCGMTLILVDAVEMDREMVTSVPKDGTRFTMRGYPAPACRDNRDDRNRE